MTGSAGEPLRVDRQGRFALTLVTVVAPDGTKTKSYAIADAWSHDLRALDLQAELGVENLTGALSNGWIDRNLRYAFRIGQVAGTPTLQRVSLLGDGAPACEIPDVNCDGWVRIAILGDSYISGEGAADGIDDREPPVEPAQPYHACTDIVQEGQCGYAEDGRSHENKCHRSSASWAMRVATHLASGAEDVLFAACSGAITDDILDRGQYDGLDGRPGPSPWGVFGGQRQLDALADFQAYRDTDVVLLSIGGNDVKFSSVVKRCLLKACLVWPFSAWKDDAQHEAENIDGRVATTISAIREVADSAHVYVAGYPDPTGLEQCGATGVAGISPDEQAWLRYWYIGSLNQSIEEAADAAGATYLPFEDAFAGHEICSELAYANGLKGGNDIIKAIGNESFHPNAFGHRKLAQIAEPYLESLDGGLRPTLTVPVISGTSHPALQVTAADGSGISQADPGSTVLLQGTGAPPNSAGQLVFNSLPTHIGTWSSNSSGEWTVSSQIPQSASPGMHTIMAVNAGSGGEVASTEVWIEAPESCPPDPTAPDADGDELPDACDPVALDGPAADADGDEVLNEADNCAVKANLWQEDWDEDGLGNACDPDAGGTLEDALRSPGNLPPEAPELTLEAREESSRNATVYIDGHDPEDLPATLVHRCSLDGEAPTVCTSPVLLVGLDLGTHQLEVTSGDPAGNLSPAATIDWEVTEFAPPGVPPPPDPWTGNSPSSPSPPIFEDEPFWIYEFPETSDAVDCARLGAAVDRARRGYAEAQRRYRLARSALRQAQESGPSSAVRAEQGRVRAAKRNLRKSGNRLRAMARLLSRSC
jgi:lysophospholipase L1-like esterase